MKKFFLIIVFFNLSFVLPAQDIQHYQKNWLSYFLQFKLGDKWALHFDAQYRGDEKFKQIQQHILRPGVQYFISPNINVTLGYTYVNSTRSNPDQLLTEHRIWQQVIFQKSFNKWSNTLRFRQEQRFAKFYYEDSTGKLSATEGLYHANRFRIFDRLLYTFCKKETCSFYAAAQNEVFLHVNTKSIFKNAFDQNRLLLAVGIFHMDQTRFEIGYMNQLTSGFFGKYNMNHILHFSILQSLRIPKKQA